MTQQNAGDMPTTVDGLRKSLRLLSSPRVTYADTRWLCVANELEEAYALVAAFRQAQAA